MAKLYRLKWNFLLFICSVFELVPVSFNINFKFPLCACVVSVDILFLCPCFSCSIFCYFHHFIDHLSGIFLTDFWERNSVELWGFKNFWSSRKWHFIYFFHIYILWNFIYCHSRFYLCFVLGNDYHASVKLPLTKKISCNIFDVPFINTLNTGVNSCNWIGIVLMSMRHVHK